MTYNGGIEISQVSLKISSFVCFKFELKSLVPSLEFKFLDELFLEIRDFVICENTIFRSK